MKSLIIAAALAAGAIGFANATPAHAQGVSVQVGTRYHHHYRDRWHSGYRAYGAARCRLVVRHTWRHGHRVTIRERRCW